MSHLIRSQIASLHRACADRLRGSLHPYPLQQSHAGWLTFGHCNHSCVYCLPTNNVRLRWNSQMFPSMHTLLSLKLARHFDANNTNLRTEAALCPRNCRLHLVPDQFKEISTAVEQKGSRRICQALSIFRSRNRGCSRTRNGPLSPTAKETSPTRGIDEWFGALRWPTR